MAAAIGINNSWINNKDWTGMNADDIIESGYYLCTKTLTNVPKDYGMLFCITQEGVHTVQLYFAATSTNIIYYRNRTSAVWTSWQSISIS